MYRTCTLRPIEIAMFELEHTLIKVCLFVKDLKHHSVLTKKDNCRPKVNLINLVIMKIMGKFPSTFSK